MVNKLALALLALAAMSVPANALPQERFGFLTGQVTDQQNAPLAGATITITNTQTQEVRTLTTDGQGRYRAELAPGRYTVRISQTGFANVEHENVLVLLGATFEVPGRMQLATQTETVRVTAGPSLIDTRSTQSAHNITEEEFNRMPKARSFQSVAITAPSVNEGQIEGGIQVNGASGAENAFTIDGITTNSLVNGQSRQNTLFEYLQEVQVKTVGISAQYGGALGGVVSAVTKSGGNTFSGEAHFFAEGSALRASPVKRLVLEPSNEDTAFYIQDSKPGQAIGEFGGSVGGPIVRDRLFFFGSYSPRRNRQTSKYNYTDGTNNEITRTIWEQQAFGKWTVALPRVRVNGSVLWTPTKADGTLAAYDGATPDFINRAQSGLRINIDRGYETNMTSATGSVNFTLTPGSMLSARSGFFRDKYTDTGIPNVTPYTYGNSTESVNAIIPASLQGLSGFANTPRAQIAEFDTTERATFDVEYLNLFNAYGTHAVQGGYGFQRTTNDINTYYPGGYVNIFWGRTLPQSGLTGTYGYYEVNDRRVANKTGNNIHSLFIEDQWNVNPRLTVNLGLRTENERIPTFRPDFLDTAFQFGFGEKLAPRLGAAYDLAGDGRVKVFGSWGLYYDWTKYELVRGSFGAETWCIYYRGLNSLDLDSISLSNMPGPDIWTNPGSCRDRRVPSFDEEIDPDIEPMKQSSTSFGADFQVGNHSVVTVHYVHNDLLETIEDVGFLNAVGDEGYLIGNPGKRSTAIQFPTGATPVGFATPRPKRKYDAVELGYNRRFSGNWFFSANYTISRLWGNYAGLASSDEISTPTTGGSSAVAQQQAGSISRPGGNVNRAWDLDELLFDSHGNLDVTGRLATDRPHVLKLYGGYTAPWGTNFGGFIYAGSGTPISTYVTSTHSADLFVNGRGDMGRTPALVRTDLHVSHDLRMAEGRSVRLELTVLNLFNRKTTRHIFNFLNKGGIIPDRTSSYIDLSHTDLSKGYDYNALILASPDGADAYDPRYGKADLFDPGTRAYATFKFLF
jgi:outer membrane receptor protein involved in Fe transport